MGGRGEGGNYFLSPYLVGDAAFLRAVSSPLPRGLPAVWSAVSCRDWPGLQLRRRYTALGRHRGAGDALPGSPCGGAPEGWDRRLQHRGAAVCEPSSRGRAALSFKNRGAWDLTPRSLESELRPAQPVDYGSCELRGEAARSRHSGPLRVFTRRQNSIIRRVGLKHRAVVAAAAEASIGPTMGELGMGLDFAAFPHSGNHCGGMFLCFLLNTLVLCIIFIHVLHWQVKFHYTNWCM